MGQMEEQVLEFGGYALDAIRKLQVHVRELQDEIEERDKQLDIYEAKIDALLAEARR